MLRPDKSVHPERPDPIRAVHQLVPMLVPGDATSDHAIQLRRLAHDMGLESEIFATAIHDDLHDECFLVHELPDRRLPGTLLVYQMSSGSEMVHLARERHEPLAVNYHNVTPSWAYEHWQPAIAAEQRWARRQLSLLADRASFAICDSSYNASELDAAGYRNTVVCPVLVDMERLGSARSTPGLALAGLERLRGAARAFGRPGEMAFRRADRPAQGAAQAGGSPRLLREALWRPSPPRFDRQARVVSLRAGRSTPCP